MGSVEEGSRFEGLARAETMPSSHTVVAGPVSEALNASAFTGTVLPCGEVAHARVCGLLRLGAFEGSAPSLPDHTVQQSLYAAVGVRLGYWLRLSDAVGIEPSLEADVPLTRTALNAKAAGPNDGSAPLWLAPVVSGSAAITVHLSF